MLFLRNSNLEFFYGWYSVLIRTELLFCCLCGFLNIYIP